MSSAPPGPNEARLEERLAQLLEQAARDQVERERMAGRLRLLADSAHDFSEATGDYDRLLAVIARRVGEALGDLCAIRSVSEDGVWLELGELYHQDPDTVSWIRRFSASQPQRVGEGVTGRVAASQQPLFLPSLAEHEFAASAPAEYREFLERLEIARVQSPTSRCCQGARPERPTGGHGQDAEADPGRGRGVGHGPGAGPRARPGRPE